MTKNLVANATTSIGAARRKVWEALVTPAAIKQYMFGADVESNWSKGSEIRWKGEVKGKKFEDKGIILKIEPDKALQYSHFSPLSGKPDRAENYHTVSFKLSGSGNETEVSLSQDNNPDEKVRKQSEKNWGVMLDGLKKYVEGASQAVEPANDASTLIHQYFSAYERKDRQDLEALLNDNFTFRSPHDPHLDRQTYFKKCWPNSRNTAAFQIEKLIDRDGEAFVTYECTPKVGSPFSNTEFFRLEGGKLSEVRVFYGSLVKAA
jgi:uncharacterized protein YndB with AHSA1/START domain/ketosteroid isomerase-like protein